MNLDEGSELSGIVIEACIAVHREIGPGEDEIAYEQALSLALGARGIPHERQLALPLHYKGHLLDCGFRVDTQVDGHLPLELKSIEKILPLHHAQLLTYLRLLGQNLGLLVNFDVPMLHLGIKRMAARIPRSSGPAWENPPERSPDALTDSVIASACEVHQALGPGSLRSVYEECFCCELTLRKINFIRRHLVPLEFLGFPLSAVSTIPLVVDSRYPVMCISADTISPLHVSRLVGQLRRSNWRDGLIINFSGRQPAESIRHIRV